MSPSQVRQAIATLPDETARSLLFDWKGVWAREQQLPPAWAWVLWLILAGRGFGKTRTGAEWVRDRVESGQGKRLIIAGPTSDDIRDIMIEGESGLLAVSPPWNKPIYLANKSQVVWPKCGAKALCITAEKPDRFRGKQCFVAGTMVATSRGDVPIERVVPGDKVLTRHGYFSVSNAMSSVAEVGRVLFSDGTSLVGTRDHPVWSGGDWWELGYLSAGSKTWSGELVRTATSSGTPTGSITSSTASFGSRTTVPYPTDGTCTTRTGTGRTMPCQTSNASHSGLTTTDISTVESGKPSFAPSAAEPTQERDEAAACVPRANRQERTLHDRGTKRLVSTAEGRFLLALADTVRSVVSTWEHVGARRVFNLTVEGCHEYFANGVLVHNCDSFWCDELASWRYPDAWNQLQLGFRLGTNPQGIVTTTPRPTPLIKKLVARAGQDVAMTRGTTYDNRANLAKQFLDQIIREYEGTRLGRQELEAEILEDNPNALWVRTRIDDLRVMSRDDLPQMRRVVVAIDPAVSTNPRSNETGIIVVGLGENGHAYVLDDLSGIYSPAQWAARAIEAFDRWEADYIVGEVNNGGDLVERNVQVERDDAPPFKSVHASRGKQVRADPISTLYEQGRVHHLGVLGRLEDQMCGWDPANDSESPDRVDALVWGVTFLDLNKKQQDYDGIRRGRRSARGR